MPTKNGLPALPPSDQGSLTNNWWARKFWKNNEIIRNKVEDKSPCKHEFIAIKGGVKCEKCHFGLLGGELSIRKGTLYAQGKPIRFTV